MKISELTIRNMKSFGNNRQTLRFPTDKGQLILLTGENGAGKSTILESVEYTLYGMVKVNKKKKKATLDTLPNRMNGNMETSLRFISENKTSIKINRGIAPSVLEFSENGSESNDKAGKGNINTKIEEYIGFDINTFKSFISMSINDFKNFIELSTEDRQNLIDKLFNLEVINELNTVLKTVVSANKKKINRLDGEIDMIKSNILSIKDRIEKAKQREEEDHQDEIDKLTEDINNNKEEFISLKNKLTKIKERKETIEKDIQTEQRELSDLISKIKIEERGINLYQQNKCPTCGTDFQTNHFSSMLQTMIDKKDSLLKLSHEIEANIDELKTRLKKGTAIENDVQKLYNDLYYFLDNTKKNIERLKQKKNTNVVSTSIDEFEKTITDFKSSYKEKKTEFDEYNSNDVYYKELSRLFGEDGVRKNIISGLIKPINQFVKQNLEVINLPYSVVLDDTFTATIKTFNLEIDPDTLSTGEIKLINICIMLAYLVLIRAKKSINILFLDEVFSSISVKNIDILLLLLQNFAYQNKVNVILVHHAVLNPDRFDKIITVKKDTFTTMSMYDVSQMSPESINELMIIE